MDQKELKILVTLGPSSLMKTVINKCDEIGVYLYRINLSHTPLSDLANLISKVQEWTKTPICLDSEGAQLRNQKMVNEDVLFKEGEEVVIHHNEVVGDSNNISFNPPGVSRQLEIGDTIKVDFRNAELKIVDVKKSYCLATVVSSGVVGSNKAADVDRVIEFDPLTKKDIAAIRIGLNLGITNFALSFANRRADVELMKEVCGADSNIICKIESKEGLTNLLEILSLADQVLIDRGDLSRQIPIQKIPFLQRKIISLAVQHKKPVFVATNLLESMVTQKTPTRAEVNDVVSTIQMGANGLVLAAETAVGQFPDGAVKMINELIVECKNYNPDKLLEDLLIN